MLLETLQENWFNPAYDEHIASLWRGATIEEQNQAIEFLVSSGPILSDKNMHEKKLNAQNEFSFDVYQSPLKYLFCQVNKGMFHLNEQQFSVVQQVLESSHELAYALVHEKQLSQAFCEVLVAHFDSTIRSTIAFRNELSPLIIETLATDYNSNVRWTVALRDDLPRQVREILAKDEEPSVKAMLEDPKLGRQLLNAEPSRLVVSRIPANTRLPHEKVLALTKDIDVYKRQRLAAWDELPEDIIRILAKDKDKLVRMKITEYHDLPDDVTEQLVNDVDEYVRNKIAVHGKLDQTLMEVLMHDSDSGVRHSLTKRSHLPATVLQHLPKDLETDVRHTIALHKDMCWEWLYNIKD